MKITMTATDNLTRIDGVPVRLWEGETEQGTKCKVFVHRVTVHKNADCAAFERELKEQMPPGQVIPWRNIL